MFDLIVSVVLIFALRHTYKVHRARSVVPSSDIWLEVLDSEEWRIKETLIYLMQEKKKTTRNIEIIFDHDMHELVTDGVVDVRLTAIQTSDGGHRLGAVFRLSGEPGGRKRKNINVGNWWQKLGINLPLPQPA
jgi:hypothetical protein